MVFIDGSNFYWRLRDAKLKVLRPLRDIFFRMSVHPRQLNKVFLYTTERYYKAALNVHGEKYLKVPALFKAIFIRRKGRCQRKGCKGVDALLVANLVYHAAMKNAESDVVVTCDADLAYALRRVEGSGCRTAAVSVCAPLSEALRRAADAADGIDKAWLISREFAEAR